ncbi:RNA polymerase sigma factor [Sporosarcina beigongshangi]|uniref:RNA polymerase sigma factor n=1 Tax=Sporosarcina beigongshangi TaxID=2782538 RepID=UPI00193A3BAF|nr:RNA polymerase sigma factor [Sporosarcina beigongshangi]
MLNNIFQKNKQQNREAERIIFEQYYKRVYYAAYYVIKDQDLAEDITQETFMKAFKNLHTVQDVEKMGAWLSIIATRTAIDHLRRLNKWNDFTTSDVYIDTGADTTRLDYVSTVETGLEKAYVKELLLEEIDKLKPDHKEVLLLFYHHDLTYEEIAAILDVQLATVKSRMFRAKKKLKESIEQQPELMEVISHG